MSCVMSPWLLNVYMDGVVREVNVRVLGKGRGRVDDLSFLEYLSPLFLLIEIHCTFSFSYKILPYFLYYYCILVRM